MLFNSYPFLLVFLPVVLLGYQIAAHLHRHAVVAWLCVASLFFYGYWRPEYLVLLCGSVLFNYFAGCLLSQRIRNPLPARGVLVAAIGVDLAVLCFYKYLFPLLNFAGTATGGRHWTSVVLPLGISFFTFTQIAYLVDLEQGDAVQQDLGSYTLFATFFPHLIAGPILHHREMMPQFQRVRDYRLRADDMAVGCTWFILGLCKKVLFADRFAQLADPAFAHTAGLGTYAAWVGTLAYSLQLYFDFSGYSDMALGLARMFSIEFPVNFNSPYKAASIIDFWQRWHMTLTRYINSYLFNPVSVWVTRRRVAQGKKISRKAMATPAGFAGMIAGPTVFSLLVAGVWHGAGMQFVVFGALHAVYLTVNHGWRIFRGPREAEPGTGWTGGRALVHAGQVLLTFLCVVVAQVFFRASGVGSALAMLAALGGLHHLAAVSGAYRPPLAAIAPVLCGLGMVWLLPNTQQILGYFRPGLETRLPAWIQVRWQPKAIWGLALGLLFFTVLVKMENPTSFLYFQF